jgi:hypothetical protein
MNLEVGLLLQAVHQQLELVLQYQGKVLTWTPTQIKTVEGRNGWLSLISWKKKEEKGNKRRVGGPRGE